MTASRLPAGVRVTLTGLEDLSAVMAHPSGLALVFTNLLENAADALGGAGQVTIRGATRQGQVEIIVSDDGPGIAPELHERIFELNFSGRRTPAVRAGKLGFGLWWVRTLMTRLGGTIGVASDGRHGASFVLRLPCQKEDV